MSRAGTDRDSHLAHNNAQRPQGRMMEGLPLQHVHAGVEMGGKGGFLSGGENKTPV